VVGEALQQRGPLLAGQVPRESQRAQVLVLRLAGCSQRRRVLAGRGGVAKHGRPVSGRLGVMGQPGQVGCSKLGPTERRQRATVQRDRAIRRQRVLDREPGQLVSEHDPVGLGAQDAGAQALFESTEPPVGHRLQQPHLDALRDHRDGVEQIPRGGAQPSDACEHRVADRSRDDLASRRE